MTVKPATQTIVRDAAREVLELVPSRPWAHRAGPERVRDYVAHRAAFLAVDRMPDSERPGVRSPSVRWVPSEAVKAFAEQVAGELVPDDWTL